MQVNQELSQLNKAKVVDDIFNEHSFYNLIRNLLDVLLQSVLDLVGLK